MTPAGKAFWRRYNLLVHLLPAYLLAAVCYGLAWRGLQELGLTNAAAQAEFGIELLISPAVLGWPVLLGSLGLLGYFRALPALAERWAGLYPAAPDTAQLERLRQLQASTGLAVLPVRLLDLDAVHFLSVLRSGDSALLRISTHSALLPDAQLRCLLAHEQAHAVQPQPRFDLPSLSWLAAWPLVWCSTALGYPLLTPVLAALQVSLWLRWQALRTARREASADRRAANAVGQDCYLLSLLEHLADFESPGSRDLRARRLRGMGLSPAELAGWLAGRS